MAPRGGGVQIQPAEDFSSPYYLHPSDNPGLQLVSQPLDGSNYINWSRSMTTALVAKNKLLFVNGVLLKPSDDDLLYHAWIRCNSMVVSWIRNSLSPQICSSIMYLDDAKEIWSDLRDRFAQCDSARVYQLKQRIMSLTQGDDDINNYFTNLRIVWDEYKHTQPISWCICPNCRCQSATKWHKHQEEECVMQFLIGLHSSYSQIRSHILSMVPLPTLSKVFALVLQEERQRTIGGNKESVKYSPILPTPSEQPYSANAASSQFNRGRLCSHCGKTNHTVDRCFSLHGYPPSFGRGKFKPPPNSRDYGPPKSVNLVDEYAPDSSDKTVAAPAMPTFEQCQQLITLLQSQLVTNTPSTSNSAAQHTSSPTQSPPFTGTTLYTPIIANMSLQSPIWLLDTGATHHVCCNKSLFSSDTMLKVMK
ncbi:uncharacterized protein LOC121774384 [Salvia splendens]|uniref:uncharacterized protein LOC121774384 n=1 Tax=Salvia splendens TaxID=180675 RepID=UPI001C25DF4A|nr:uncharacterized protein LOC121774384 [Salvia splendens]